MTRVHEIINSGEPGYLTATVTPTIEKDMKEKFNLEIEMMQGKRKVLRNGMIKYKIKISDPQKIEMVVEFILRVMAKDFHKPESGN